MKTSVFVALAAVAVVTTAMGEDHAASVVAAKGQVLTAANGARLGTVYRVGSDGSPQLILDGKMVTVPVATLSGADGKLTTSLTKSEVLALH